jgi:hypothetical protein
VAGLESRIGQTLRDDIRRTRGNVVDLTTAGIIDVEVSERFAGADPSTVVLARSSLPAPDSRILPETKPSPGPVNILPRDGFSYSKSALKAL